MVMRTGRATGPLLAGYQYARRVAALAHGAIFQDFKAHRFDQLRNAAFYLAPPERRGERTQHLVDGIEDGGVLANQDHGQLAASADDPAKFSERTDDIVAREQLEEITAKDGVEGFVAKGHLPRVYRLAMRSRVRKLAARRALRACGHVRRQVHAQGGAFRVRTDQAAKH